MNDWISLGLTLLWVAVGVFVGFTLVERWYYAPRRKARGLK